MASLNIEEIINKEVARRVANELELRKEEVSSAARESLEKINKFGQRTSPRLSSLSKISFETGFAVTQRAV